MATEEFTLDFKTQREWGWLAVLDFFLAGGGAGAFLLGILLNVYPAVVIGVIGVGLGALALLADLGRPERAWRAISNPGTSWISRGALIVGVFLLFAVVHILLTLSNPNANDTVVKAIAGIAAVGVMAYTGFLLSFSPAIPAWHSTLLPVMFIASSLITGMGALLVVGAVADRLPAQARGSWDQTGLLLMVTALILALAYITTMLSSTLAARQAIQQLTKGDLSLPFLGGVILAGLVAPLAIFTILYLGDVSLASASVAAAIAGILLIVGGVSLRHSLLRAGVYQPIV
ncbi:MAG: polysulfide reductase NrfD [Chloroflexi bacterium]|nr:polysulfide reductase NrfD [Chloroflexota bacterium]